MNVLVAYASKYGSTEGIAERIAQVLNESGHEATLARASRAGSLESYDAFVIGSALYMFSWLREAKRFVESNTAGLAAKPVWLFSSGPVGTQKVDAQGRDVLENAGPRDLAELQTKTHARDHRVFFGAFDHTKLTVGHRLIYAMPALKEALPDGDFRDWPDIESWAKTIAASLAAAEVPA